MTQQSGTSNLSYELRGLDIQITYTPSNDLGQPELDYQTSLGTRVFAGNEIRIEQSMLGTLVTVFLLQTVDTGSTTLTVLLPGVNLANTTEQDIQTIAIVTHNLFSIMEIHKPRQTQTYEVYNLQGTVRGSAITDVVTLTVDAPSYNVGDTVTVTLNNQSNQTISFPDHLTHCTVIELQRQVDGNWQQVNPCALLISTRIHTLDAGQSLPVELVAATDVAGFYRATMSYSTSADFSEPRTTIYSPEFQVTAGQQG